MHLDNSACNLASLNLLKFLRQDGTFDVAAFKHAVEIVFLAQEIIVGNSSYPTEKITENAKDFRQLGLGYANLGALLMALGKAYDSDGGRAWAGSITALMTGHAYRTSARIAQVTGPFAGYPKNREPMLRVMGKHRAAVDEIDASLVQTDLFEAARTAWDEAIEFGQEYGYRNAQARCSHRPDASRPTRWSPPTVGLSGSEPLGDTHGPAVAGSGPHRRHRRGPGRRPSSTSTARSRPAGSSRSPATPSRARFGIASRWSIPRPAPGSWRQLAESSPTMSCRLQLGTLVGEPRQVPLPVLDQAYWTGERVRAPITSPPTLAELVGYYMGDGSLHAKGLRSLRCRHRPGRDRAVAYPRQGAVRHRGRGQPADRLPRSRPAFGPACPVVAGQRLCQAICPVRTTSARAGSRTSHRRSSRPTTVRSMPPSCVVSSRPTARTARPCQACPRRPSALPVSCARCCWRWGSRRPPG